VTGCRGNLSSKRRRPITAFGSCFAASIFDRRVARGYNLFGRNLGTQAHVIRFGGGMLNTSSIRRQWEHNNDAQLFYFPSFEIVAELFADPSEEDNRHVLSGIVDFTMAPSAGTPAGDECRPSMRIGLNQMIGH
jgi:hypothetical protein